MTLLASPSLCGLAPLLSGLSLGSTARRADGFPADTNTIESLTAEQARMLAAELSVAHVPGVSVQLETEGVGPLTLRRCVTLKGLKAVDAETAQALAGYAIGPILLDGLATLSDDAARALSQHKCWLSLNGLNRLSLEASRGLADGESWDGYLVSLTDFGSPDSVAQALATRKGSLLLPTLKKISPKTLSGLLAKNDVEIPLVESLELISEPDGSTTEDVIIPEWLRERQNWKRAAQAAG